MPSANKTAVLGLNQWTGNEYPKREDFNADNLSMENAFVAHSLDNTKRFTDIEYQIPTIVGTQIQLVRLGGSKRLFFYLSADLTGSITISLDAGATSLPLKDYDDVQLAELTKGYVEVVDNITFFTYAPKGGASKLNVYTGMSEPTKKEGIWMQTNKSFNKIITDKEIFLGNTWTPSAPYGTIPFTPGNTCGIPCGKKIYSINQSTYLLWIYDTVLKTWSNGTPPPYTGAQFASGVVIGTDLYFSGGYGGSGSVKSFYKYNTLNDTWTQLADLPTATEWHGSVTNGSKIITFGGTSGSAANALVYSYDIATNVWTTKTSMPKALVQHTAILVGNLVFIMGGRSYASGSLGANNTTNYYYNIDSDTWKTTTSVIPLATYNSVAISIGQYIYIICKNTTTAGVSKLYKYDTVSDTWVTLADTPSTSTSYGSLGGFIESLFYVFRSATTVIEAYSFTGKIFEENSLVIVKNNLTSGTYYTELITPLKPVEGLFTRLVNGFNDVWLFVDSKLNEYPSYYGDGTQWIKFKG